MEQIWQPLYREIVRQHIDIEWEVWSIVVAYDIGIMNKVIKNESN